VGLPKDHGMAQFSEISAWLVKQVGLSRAMAGTFFVVPLLF
jgi:hypothetical protein